MLALYSRDPAVRQLFADFRHAVFPNPRIEATGALTWSFDAEFLRGVTELVPSFSDPGSPDIVARFSVIAIDHADGASRIDFDPIGGAFPTPPERVVAPGVSLDIDTLKFETSLKRLDVTITFAHRRAPSVAAVVALSFRTPGGTAGSIATLGEGELFVPPLSQFAQSETIGHRICSPPSVSMVLGYYGVSAAPLALADRAYTSAHDLYGVWPANIGAAATFGIGGVLCHLITWDSVDYFLRRDIPVVASIRYTARDLRDAAFYRPTGETTAHLVVVRGARDGRVIVNDPAGRTESEVRREYDAAEFARVWFEGSGMAYILIPPGSPRW
jgi:hypothetical protein